MVYLQSVTQEDRGTARVSVTYGVWGAEERFPSGQREQTVNLPAMPSKVRILPSPPILFAGIAQLVEREPSKLGVAGSSPVSRSNLLYDCDGGQQMAG